MRSNRNPILRCAVGEGKSGSRARSGFEHAKKGGEGPRVRSAANRIRAGRSYRS
jgi:hypothetical protein